MMIFLWNIKNYWICSSLAKWGSILIFDIVDAGFRLILINDIESPKLTLKNIEISSWWKKHSFFGCPWMIRQQKVCTKLLLKVKMVKMVSKSFPSILYPWSGDYLLRRNDNFCSYLRSWRCCGWWCCNNNSCSFCGCCGCCFCVSLSIAITSITSLVKQAITVAIQITRVENSY